MKLPDSHLAQMIRDMRPGMSMADIPDTEEVQEAATWRVGTAKVQNWEVAATYRWKPGRHPMPYGAQEPGVIEQITIYRRHL